MDEVATRVKDEDRPDPSPDLHPPEKIAKTARKNGVKMAGLDLPVLAMLGVLAGAYIAFGGLFFLVAIAGAQDVIPHGAAQVLGGVVFSLGLVLVVVGGAELFTGNTLLVVAWAGDHAGFAPVVRALGLAYVTNFVGSVLIVLMAFWAEVHMGGNGAVGAATLRIAEAKTALPFGTAFASGILANMLVCLAVWLAFGARSAADKVLVVIPPIAAFVALGLEHSVANMSLIPFGLLVLEGAGPEFWQATGLDRADYPTLGVSGFLRNLAAATIGNIIGGFAVAAAYWFAYLRTENDD